METEHHAALALSCFLAEYNWPLRVPTREMSLKQLWGCPDELLAGLLRLPRKNLPRLAEFRSRFSAPAMLEQLKREGTSFVTLGEPGYPGCLAQIHDPPPALFMKGATPLSEFMEQPRVAIVGARAASRYGLDATASIARGLSRSGICVVSGMALGIDAAAHTGSLEHAGCSLAVLGCGPDVVYPAANRSLYRSLLERGLVVSEYPPHTQPMPWRFPARNRIMAGLSNAVIVVEARAKSGSLITAEFALDEGREVFAVPGSIFSELSSGPHVLIRSGAAAVTSAEDVLESLGLELDQQRLPFGDLCEPADGAASGPCDRPANTAASRPTSGQTKRSAFGPAGLSYDEQRLFRVLEALPCHPDLLATKAGLDGSATISALISLELKGLARLEPGRGYCRC